LLNWIRNHFSTVIPSLVAVLAVSALAVSLSGGAGAQTAGGSSASIEANQAFTCGRELSSVVRTWENAFHTHAGIFVPITGAALNVTLPAGTDCILVTFNGKFWTPGVGDTCYLKAFLGATELSPTGGNLRSIISFDMFEARTFIWAGKVTTPSTTQSQVRIEMSSNTAFSDRGCNVEAWVLNIERKD
jgi:hypothetical protein